MRELQEQRMIVESFRSGVPSRRVASSFPMGRERILDEVRKQVTGLQAAGPRALFFKANYGDGKTHLLYALSDLALREECVVSLVTLSKETPFDQLHRLYPKVVAGTYLPQSTQPGIEQLLSDVRSGSPVADELLEFAETSLHPRLAIVLRNYMEGPSVDAQYPLYQDLSGEFIKAQNLKAIHRLNFQASVNAGRFTSQDAWNYFLLLDTLVRVRGYRGWVILFDEAELIGTLGIGGRARSYANISRFMSGQAGLQSTLAVFTVATSFYADIMDHRNDGVKAPEWLRARGFYDVAAQADVALDGLVSAPGLQPLNEEQLRRVMDQMVKAHGEAYAWQPPVAGPDLLRQILEKFPARDTKLRTRIRAGIQWLDQLMQYGEDPVLSLDELVEETVTGGDGPEGPGGGC